MAKADKFYFDNLAESAAFTHTAAEYLAACLQDFAPENIRQMLDEMHMIEHSADRKKHAMHEALAKAFVTPVDREDLDMLSHRLDDVTDLIEETLQKFYIYDVRQMEPSAVEFARKLVSACKLLQDIVREFEHFKRSKSIRTMIIALNDVEEECDHLYLDSMRALTQHSADVLQTIAWREIFECMEECADACEHAGECIATVIMKNT